MTMPVVFTDFTAFTQRFDFDFVKPDSKLGEGNYGQVVKGWDNEWPLENDKRASGWVALKRSFKENDRSVEREYETAKALDHPNVMRYVAYGRLTAPNVGERDYLVMPYYEDGNLYDFIHQNTLTTLQTRSVVRGLLEGLAYLHGHQRQHRDLKGSNILIGRDPATNQVVPVIADFGSTKQVKQSNSGSFSQSEHAKTIANAAPEQIQGEASVNYNVDLWAFGVVLYEIITGQHPFNYGLDELEPDTARKTLSKRIVAATLPEDIRKKQGPYWAMIRQCLVVDRKQRVQKAENLLAILANYKAPEPGTDPFGGGAAKVEMGREGGWGWVFGGIFVLFLLILVILNQPSTTADESSDTTDSTAMMSDTTMATDSTMASDSTMAGLIELDTDSTATEPDVSAIKRLAKQEYDKQNYGEAFRLLQQAADQGDAAAQYELGLLYARGHGVDKDYKQAYKWFKLAADQGDATAQYTLGYLYDEGGGGLPQDYQQAYKWYKLAADQGHKTAQNNIGHLYNEGGYGVPQDYKQAYKWYKLAADQGHAVAQCNLGYLYDTGYGEYEGVPQDYHQAHKWYKLSADQGNESAQNKLGNLYEEGNGVDQDYKQAYKWYKSAADQGHATSQYDLGQLYEYGHIGESPDKTEAIKWYKLAAIQSNYFAIEALKRLGQDVSAYK